MCDVRSLLMSTYIYTVFGVVFFYLFGSFLSNYMEGSFFGNDVLGGVCLIDQMICASTSLCALD